MNLVIHTDGGARGNPGPAAIGVVIQNADASKKNSEHTIAEFGKRIGETTNNVAEYTAVIEALMYLTNSPRQKGTPAGKLVIHFFLDSTLVVNQLNGLFRVKEPHLRELLIRVRMLEGEVGGVITYEAVPREKNTRADYFVNCALDES